MKVLLLSTYDLHGGAARAAYRLHEGLTKVGVDSQMLVQGKTSDNPTVIGSPTQLQKEWGRVRPIVDAIPLHLYRHRDRAPYSLQWLPNKIDTTAADIINLHWTGKGFISVETIAKFDRPVVWTLHDMWAFTGGCHYTQNCDRYIQSCGNCPQLNSNRDWDLSKWVWQRKTKAWRNLDLTIVTPSRWLAKCASMSSLFQDLPIKVIPYGLDIQRYKPVDKHLAKEIVGIAPDKQIVLFGAVSATSNPRKGFQYLIPALQKLKHSPKHQIELVIFGSSRPNNPPDLGCKVHYLGKLGDDLSLSLLYAAADVFVVPSIQDNFPNTVMEALACGTPCVAFNIGGMPDTIDHKQNGYLAQPFIEEDLAAGIEWILADRQRHQQMAIAARNKVEQFYKIETQGQNYSQLFASILNNR